MTRLDRWERHTQTPLLALAVLFALAFALPILFPQADPRLLRGATWAEWATWAAFTADYGIRLTLAERRWAFVRGNPLALLAVVLPLVQPLRLLRLVSTVLLAGQRVRMAAQVRLTTYVVGAVLGLLVFGSLAVLEIERNSPDANIRTLDDALWWSFTTMTTVGYGDHTPTTGLGRLLAVGLMLSGIALLGVVTANIAAWFIARFEAEERLDKLNHQAILELTAEVRELRRQLADVTGAGGGGGGGGGGVGAEGSGVGGSGVGGSGAGVSAAGGSRAGGGGGVACAMATAGPRTVAPAAVVPAAAAPSGPAAVDPVPVAAADGSAGRGAGAADGSGP